MLDDCSWPRGVASFFGNCTFWGAHDTACQVGHAVDAVDSVHGTVDASRRRKLKLVRAGFVLTKAAKGEMARRWAISQPPTRYCARSGWRSASAIARPLHPLW